MIKDITLGQYIPGDSLLHKADPRIKILLTILFMTVLFIINTYMEFLMLSIFTVLTVIVSGIPFKYTLKGLKPIIVIVIFTGVINLLFSKGTPIFKLWYIQVTYEGVETTIKMALRLILIVTGASLLTLTTTPIVLTDGVEKLMGVFKRFGFPAHEVAMMMTIALRFIPTLLEETDKIMKAQASRGADFDTGNLINRAKSFIPVLVPLFISAFRRADELALAMESRCYRGGTGRTRLRQLRMTRADLYISGIMCLFSAFVFFLHYGPM
jgi:energy-coupling factor transport system permease protein